MARPRVSPSLAWTCRACTRSASPFATPLASESSLMPVVNNWSRVLNSSTRSTSGKTKCAPGYSVPGRVPLVWLTRTPAIPLGTTTIPKDKSIGTQANRDSTIALRQWMVGASGTEPVPGVARNCLCLASKKKSRARMAAAAAIIPAPPHCRRYLRKTIAFSLMYSALIYSALQPGFDPDRLRGKENPKYLSEDQFFYQKRDCYRKDQTGNYCHESDDELHMSFSVRAANGVAICRPECILLRGQGLGGRACRAHVGG